MAKSRKPLAKTGVETGGLPFLVHGTCLRKGHVREDRLSIVEVSKELLEVASGQTALCLRRPRAHFAAKGEVVMLFKVMIAQEGISLEHKFQLIETGLAVVMDPALAVLGQGVVKEGVWHVEELTVEPR